MIGGLAINSERMTASGRLGSVKSWAFEPEQGPKTFPKPDGRGPCDC